MRPKEPCYVISFHTTADAIAFERYAGEISFPGRLIPLPRAISAGCGMAWKIKKQEVHDPLPSLVNAFPVAYDQIYELML